jgi:hypothetical protein
MDKNHIQFILDLTLDRAKAMELGQITDCQGLFDPKLWNTVPPSERRYVFGKPIAILALNGQLSLEYAGFDKSRHNLYRRI